MSSKKKLLTIFMIINLFISSTMISSFVFAESSQNSGQDEEINYSEVRQLPDGGNAYVYNIDGVENVFPVPPDSFNPLKATDEQLREYGFPSRPKDKDALKQWQDDMSHFKNVPVPKVVRKMLRKMHGLKK